MDPGAEDEDDGPDAYQPKKLAALDDQCRDFLRSGLIPLRLS